MLQSEAYASGVVNDISLAQSLSVNGVPFFVLNNKYGISGAQPAEVFLAGLQQAWAEYEKENPLTDLSDTNSGVCTPGGVCQPVINN